MPSKEFLLFFALFLKSLVFFVFSPQYHLSRKNNNVFVAELICFWERAMSLLPCDMSMERKNVFAAV